MSPGGAGQPAAVEGFDQGRLLHGVPGPLLMMSTGAQQAMPLRIR
jgi:hypothetical protein